MSENPKVQALLGDVSAWDHLRLPVWVFDPTTLKGLYANHAALEYWDAASRDELLARDFSQLSQSVLTRVERLAQATAGGEAVSERWTFYPRGQPMTVQAVISSLPLADGRKALLFEAVAVDVEESERRAVEALRHTSSLVTLFDAEGGAIFSNPAAFAAYGDGRLALTERFCDAAHGADVLRRVLGGDVLAEFCQVRTATGERSHHLDARSVLDPVTGQVSVLVSERDVTAQVEAERALAAAHQRVEVAMAKERFLANMSHELRTPLNAVLGFAGLLARSPLQPSQTEQLGHITNAGQTLLSIVNDVITLSEIDSGELTAEARAFDPAELVERVCRGFTDRAAARGLMLQVETPEAAPWLLGDEALLKRVLGVYVDNAVKFTERGAISVELRVSPAGAGHAALELAVADTGPGIDSGMQARLFNRFTPGDDSRTKTKGGGGLGLAIARELAGLMGGEVGIESAVGAGARFWLRVELALETADKAAPAEPEALGERPTAAAEQDDRPLVLLYADDNRSNRVLVQTVLQVQGHRCDLVDDGAQALAAVQAEVYDLVLMDIQMPVMDGVAATTAIRALGGRHATIPILALTANTLADQLETYAEVGMQDCIAKPVNVVELFTKVAEWAAAAEMAEASAAA